MTPQDDRLGFVTAPDSCLGRCGSRGSTIEYAASSALFSVVPVADMFETSNDMLHLSLHCIERDHYHRHGHTHAASPDRDRIADTVT